MRYSLQLVVMGVSGCGKSTVSQAIGEKLGLQVADGDDFHSAESRAKMHSGIALEDADRWPWLDRIANHLADCKVGATYGGVVACSALKLAYRDRIRALVPDVLFIFLDGSSDLIRERMAMRQGHFMQLSLLDSQLSTLEKPTSREKDVVAINIDNSIESITAKIVSAIEERQALERVVSI